MEFLFRSVFTAPFHPIDYTLDDSIDLSILFPVALPDGDANEKQANTSIFAKCVFPSLSPYTYVE